jgi:hypothetical protein
MRLARLVSIIPFALFACGDDGGGDPVLVDAGPPDALPDAPPPPDAAPCPADECNNVCVNFDEDELTCGDCETACAGGQSCNGGTCECPATGFVPAEPTFLFEDLQAQQGATLGIGIYSSGGTHALIVPYTTAGTLVGEPYVLTEGGLGTLPAIFAGYNVDVQSQTFDAAYAATTGTLVFDTLCDVGFTGHATGLTFRGITGGFTNPQIDPDGCMFAVETLTFAYGEPCPAP